MSRKRNNLVKFLLVFCLGISIFLVFCFSEVEAAAHDNSYFTFSLFYSGTSSPKPTDTKTESKKEKNGDSEKKVLDDHKNSTSRRRAIIVD